MQVSPDDDLAREATVRKSGADECGGGAGRAPDGDPGEQAQGAVDGCAGCSWKQPVSPHVPATIP